MLPEGLQSRQTTQPESLDGQSSFMDNPVLVILTMTALPLILGLVAHIFP